MKKFLFIFTFLLSSISIVNAQSVNVTTLPQAMLANVDSLLNEWNAKNNLTYNKDCQTSDENPFFTDSVYISRLAHIPTTVELPYNDIVRKCIDQYMSKQRKQVSYILGAANFYVPLFEEALDANNIPLEFKYLPIIESALNPQSSSPSGASGLWQLMIGTGKKYGLETNTLVDERKDPIKSTWAAAQYLKELYTIYNDWNLVIAAYNCGPGNLNKAIKRANNSKDYWEIYNYLPQQTRGFVPAFIAINYVMNYYCEHKIVPMEAELSMNTDTIEVTKKVHFEQIASVCGISIDQLKSLNPQYKLNIIPGDCSPCTLRMPRNFISIFIEKQDSIFNHRTEELFTKRETVTPTETVITPKQVRVKAKAKYHRVSRGETLSEIADKYGVTVSQLKKWNRIKKNKIARGKRIKISN